MAITALVLGIVGCCLLGPLTGIPAAILGGIAMKRAKENPTEYGGYGMALTGLILGIIASVLGTLALILFIAGVLSLPAECLEDPESAACEEALENVVVDEGPVPVATLGLFAPFVPVARPWHAG